MYHVLHNEIGWLLPSRAAAASDSGLIERLWCGPHTRANSGSNIQSDRSIGSRLLELLVTVKSAVQVICYCRWRSSETIKNCMEEGEQSMGIPSVEI